MKGLRGEESIAAICRREGIHPGQYYKWSKEFLEAGKKRFTGIDQAPEAVRPRLWSDNGPCYISQSLGEYLETNGMEHTRGRPFHPMTQGKIERYHRSMKNIMLLDNDYLPMELETDIDRWVTYSNTERYHESLGNSTPRDTYLERAEEILQRRRKIKKKTLKQRREANRFRQSRADTPKAVPVS